MEDGYTPSKICAKRKQSKKSSNWNVHNQREYWLFWFDKFFPTFRKNREMLSLFTLWNMASNNFTEFFKISFFLSFPKFQSHVFNFKISYFFGKLCPMQFKYFNVFKISNKYFCFWLSKVASRIKLIKNLNFFTYNFIFRGHETGYEHHGMVSDW